MADPSEVQDELRQRLVLPVSPMTPRPATVTGLDISYAETDAIAAAVTLDVATGAIVESALAEGEPGFPYVPGLLAFREVPLLTAAIGKLARPPEVLVCDGFGLAHPRRFGLACHIGVLLDLPSFGVAKSSYVGAFDDPGPARGDWSPLRDGDEIIGRVVRTRTETRPVFVSVGHRISLDDATDLTLTFSPRYRIPEPTRRADQLSREALRRRRIS